ncbi:MAG: hypothetical protein AAF281_11375 [Pseudomonadota bacterium]
MPIEPGVVTGAKCRLSAAAAAGAGAWFLRRAGGPALLFRAGICTALVFGIVEVLPPTAIDLSKGPVLFA